MNITMLSVGSRGDTQPYIALGVELQRRGHKVRVAASEGFRGFVEQFGLEYALVRGDVARIASSDLVKDATNADSPLKFFRSMRHEGLRKLLVRMQQDLHEACAESDAVVYHPGAVVGYFAAQEMNIPSILATPFPMTPTREFPNLLFYNRMRLGRSYNWMTHRVFEHGFWLMVRGALKTYWEERFGRLPQGFGNPYPRQRRMTHPTIISCSPLVFPRPLDWSEYVHAGGYWFLDVDRDYQPPAELSAFVAAGEAPVYVGFGSIVDKAQATETTRIVTEALRQAGRRGILATGWHGMERTIDPTNQFLFIDGAPHEWLFPRMAAVVHHGGAGTTAAGLRAGVPSIVIPFGNDQFAWGRRLQELGVGPHSIPRKHLTSKLLANALQSATSPEMRERASMMGEAIRREKGAQDAAEVILRTITQYPR